MNPARRCAARSVLLAVLLASSLAAPVARADDATAESLYRDGRRAAVVKDWDLACRKFKESLEREPAPGTMLNLADCEENRGHILAALGHYRVAATKFKAGDERAEFGKQRAAALDKRVARLTIRLAPQSPAGASVERDGAPVEPAALGVPVRVDPGEHALVVRAPGRVDARGSLKVGEGETREVELAVGSATGAAPAAPAGPPAGTPSAAPPEPWHPPPPDRTAAYVVLGVGGVGLVTGAVAGVLALGAASKAHDGCPNQVCTAQDGVDAAGRARTLGLVSTLGFGAGVLGALGGTYLWLKASPTVMMGPTVGSGPGFAVRGTFE